MSYYAILQELPSIKRKVSLSDSEGFEVELPRFIVEDDRDIHRGEWYDNWQEDESWIRVLSPYMKNGYMLSKYT